MSISERLPIIPYMAHVSLAVHIMWRLYLLESLLVRIQQRLDPGPLCHQRLILIQQLREPLRLVQTRHQPLLNDVAREIDKKVHDRFGYEVLDRLPYDAKVGGDEGADEGGFHLFAWGELMAVIGCSLRVAELACYCRDVSSSNTHSFEMLAKTLHVIRRRRVQPRRISLRLSRPKVRQQIPRSSLRSLLLNPSNTKVRCSHLLCSAKEIIQERLPRCAG